MKRITITAIIILTVFLAGCEASSDAERTALGKKNDKEMVREEGFQPPADGRISKPQADKYIAVAKRLNQAIEEQIVIMQEFYNEYNIEGKEEIESLENNEEAMARWDEILKEWEAKEAKIYKEEGLSSDEFDWIASALIDDKNKAVRLIVQQELSPESE
ncbi:MAG: hypothetical protein SVK54_07120 [candidate division WOR-3 bacterium]|nr:hypothetical protein [candidate division WOR-3 bacterium]